ncbi:hypothetical protein cyc_08700 [Cyclospora cayetanensis]|uniref:Uncharacterized protein n=1 Tax=Cyclospora cayetanensis TaxID=88456 RepID=A0A1D3D288_9EIME|nr:hypothetical protein cyc_08700 [Cyclospora cayetanensis]
MARRPFTKELRRIRRSLPFLSSSRGPCSRAFVAVDATGSRSAEGPQTMSAEKATRGACRIYALGSDKEQAEA